MGRDYIIGIVGGMGSYATVGFFKRIVDAFPAEKEWERPRIIIDNYCTLPSRVRAVLYHERVDELVACMAESAGNLYKIGADRIIFACNTAHVFLPMVIEKIPEIKEKVMNLIEMSAIECERRNYRRIKLLATEGTYLSYIYPDIFKEHHISVNHSEDETDIRALIEDVKQNKINKRSKDKFLELIQKEIGGGKNDGLVLGCTELPVLYSCLADTGFYGNVVDPLQCVINELKKEFTSISE